MWTILDWDLAGCVLRFFRQSLCLWLCLCVILSPSAYIVFRVEEILVGTVYRLLLCIAQSVCGGGPGASPNSLQGAAASLSCHSDPPSGAQTPLIFDTFPKTAKRSPSPGDSTLDVPRKPLAAQFPAKDANPSPDVDRPGAEMQPPESPTTTWITSSRNEMDQRLMSC